MMKKVLPVVLILINGLLINAQMLSKSTNPSVDYGISLQRGLFGVEYRNPVKGYKGDLFFGPWAYGEVILNNGEKIEKIYLRYEKYLDELLWLRQSDFKQGILHKSEISSFKLYSESGLVSASFVKQKIKFSLEVDSAERYLQVLEGGKISLMVYRNVIGSPNSYSLVDNSKFLIYYNNDFKVIRLRRSDLMHLPFIDKARMKAVLRSNSLVVRNDETAMARALNLYNRQ